jgi:GR25 family glycosyltransferase involved in LPS biosynthesis
MKAKIITLKGNELSERIAKESIEQAALMNISVEYFEAINGFHSEQHCIDLGLQRAGKMRLGALGCALSHIYLWRQCVEDNEPYLILEHDGYFIEPLPDNVLDLFEDVLKLDNCDPYSAFYEQEIEKKSLNQLEVINLPEDRKTVGGVGQYSKGAYAYIIKPHAAAQLLEYISINGITKADHQLGNAVCKIKTVNKTIARLHPYYLGRVKELSTTNFLELKKSN